MRAIYGGRLHYCDHRYEAVEGADALTIVTDWEEYRSPDFSLLKDLMRGRALFDGRNVLDPIAAARAGFHYSGIGRVPAPTLVRSTGRARPRARIEAHRDRRTLGSALRAV